MFGFRIGEMSEGSICSKCKTDLGLKRGVQSGNNDFCFPCFDSLRKEKDMVFLSGIR